MVVLGVCAIQQAQLRALSTLVDQNTCHRAALVETMVQLTRLAAEAKHQDLLIAEGDLAQIACG